MRGNLDVKLSVIVIGSWGLTSGVCSHSTGKLSRQGFVSSKSFFLALWCPEPLRLKALYARFNLVNSVSLQRNPKLQTVSESTYEEPDLSLSARGCKGPFSILIGFYLSTCTESFICTQELHGKSKKKYPK